MARRLQAMGHPHYRNGFDVTLHEDALTLPLHWKRTQAIFVNSMSNLYHPDVPLRFIKKVFATMHEATWHRYQILTKRAERLAELSGKLPWAPNIWQGVTVEHADYAQRIDLLRQTDAHIKFLSLEPLLGPMPKLKLRGIDWVIVGGESGPGARPMAAEWVTDIRVQCQKAGVAFHFKQWGGVFKAQRPPPRRPHLGRNAHRAGRVPLLQALSRTRPSVLDPTSRLTLTVPAPSTPAKQDLGDHTKPTNSSQRFALSPGRLGRRLLRALRLHHLLV